MSNSLKRLSANDKGRRQHEKSYRGASYVLGVLVGRGEGGGMDDLCIFMMCI